MCVRYNLVGVASHAVGASRSRRSHPPVASLCTCAAGQTFRRTNGQCRPCDSMALCATHPGRRRAHSYCVVRRSSRRVASRRSLVSPARRALTRPRMHPSSDAPVRTPSNKPVPDEAPPNGVLFPCPDAHPYAVPARPRHTRKLDLPKSRLQLPALVEELADLRLGHAVRRQRPVRERLIRRGRRPRAREPLLDAHLFAAFPRRATRRDAAPRRARS